MQKISKKSTETGIGNRKPVPWPEPVQNRFHRILREKLPKSGHGLKAGKNFLRNEV